MPSDEWGWPVRLREDGARVCARPGPGHYSDEDEFRIDGYCSCECRDFHELELEIDSLRSLLREALAHLNTADHGDARSAECPDCELRRKLEREVEKWE